MITEKPTPWGPLPDPFTIAGSMEAADYDVSSDFRLDGGKAYVTGRIDSADVFQDSSAPLPGGYVLSVEANGDWKVLSTRYKAPTVTLAHGTVKLQASEWHRFGLAMHGSEISAFLDGNRLASIQDTSHTKGLFAIGSDWSKTQFDNLATKPIR